MGVLANVARNWRLLLTGGGRGGSIARTGAVGGGTGFLGSLFGGGDDRPRRRRRKRVLTQNDREDISFITATLGAPAGKSFAMIVAARA